MGGGEQRDIDNGLTIHKVKPIKSLTSTNRLQIYLISGERSIPIRTRIHGLLNSCTVLLRCAQGRGPGCYEAGGKRRDPKHHYIIIVSKSTGSPREEKGTR